MSNKKAYLLSIEVEKICMNGTGISFEEARDEIKRFYGVK